MSVAHLSLADEIYCGGQRIKRVHVGLGPPVWERAGWPANILRAAPIYYDFLSPAETYEVAGLPARRIAKVTNLGFAGPVFDLRKTGAALDQWAPQVAQYGAITRTTSGGVGDTMTWPNQRPTLNGVRVMILSRVSSASNRAFLSGPSCTFTLAASLSVTVSGEALSFSTPVPSAWAVSEIVCYPPGVIGARGTVGFAVNGSTEEQRSFATTMTSDGGLRPSVLFGNQNTVSGSHHVQTILSLPVDIAEEIVTEARDELSQRRDQINAALGL